MVQERGSGSRPAPPLLELQYFSVVNGSRRWSGTHLGHGRPAILSCHHPCSARSTFPFSALVPCLAIHGTDFLTTLLNRMQPRRRDVLGYSGNSGHKQGWFCMGSVSRLKAALPEYMILGSSRHLVRPSTSTATRRGECEPPRRHPAARPSPANAATITTAMAP